MLVFKINNFKNTKHELQRSDSSLRRRTASYLEIKAQKLDLLEKVAGKSSRQTERLLCESDPEIYQIKEKARYLNKDQVEIKLTLNKIFFDNLERLKNLLSHKNPNMSYGELFKILSELALDKYDPIRKQKRKDEKMSVSRISNTHLQTKERKNQENQKHPISFKKSLLSNKEDKIKQDEVKKSLGSRFHGNTNIKEARKCQSKSLSNVEEARQWKCQSKPLGNDEGVSINSKENKKADVNNRKNGKRRIDLNKEDNILQKKQSRYIPAQIKRLVWTRDKGQCTYTCPQTKKKCGSKHFLQIDHIHPYSLGGNSTLNNLRLLCASHNQYRHKLFQ